MRLPRCPFRAAGARGARGAPARVLRFLGLGPRVPALGRRPRRPGSRPSAPAAPARAPQPPAAGAAVRPGRTSARCLAGRGAGPGWAGRPGAAGTCRPGASAALVLGRVPWLGTASEWPWLSRKGKLARRKDPVYPRSRGRAVVTFPDPASVGRSHFNQSFQRMLGGSLVWWTALPASFVPSCIHSTNVFPRALCLPGPTA